MRRIALPLLALLLLSSATLASLSSAKILPTPKSVVMSEGRFTIPAQADVAKIAKATVDKTLAAEAYTLSITPKAITITGGSDTGVFWATQSLLQLVETDKAGKRTIACQTITDEPTYRWRSFMLDSGRQYQTIAHLKKTLDWMARYKLNIFHWHLTESDGWRIEIKSQPKLTEIGSKVSTGKEQQGFYTQAEIREVVAYAKARHITIVPEIDLPGHAFALMASYPEFSCKGTVDPKATDKKTRMNPIVCAGKAEADNYKFLASILNEVCDLFPNSPYIHTGGDEAPKAHWDQCPSCQALLKKHNLKNMHELQIHFTNRIAAILKARGRKAICWDDVIAKNGGPKLADNVVVNWWNYRARKDRMVFKALEMGREVILNPNNYTYLNFPISPYSVYGKGRTFGMAKCYTENPAAIGMSDKITDEQRKLILGMGASLWTDGNLMQAFLDIRTFPRIFAMSELMWHGKPAASLEDMQKLADAQKPWLKANGYVSGRAEESDGPTILPEGYTEKLKPAKKTVPRKTRKKKAAK